jgi:hypothetical protein
VERGRGAPAFKAKVALAAIKGGEVYLKAYGATTRDAMAA